MSYFICYLNDSAKASGHLKVPNAIVERVESIVESIIKSIVKAIVEAIVKTIVVKEAVVVSFKEAVVVSFKEAIVVCIKASNEPLATESLASNAYSVSITYNSANGNIAQIRTGR